MQVTTVTYGHTFGRPNYSSERIDLTATLGEGEDPGVALLVLKAEVLRLGGDERGAALALTQAHERASWQDHLPEGWAPADDPLSSVAQDRR